MQYLSQYSYIVKYVNFISASTDFRYKVYLFLVDKDFKQLAYKYKGLLEKRFLHQAPTHCYNLTYVEVRPGSEVRPAHIYKITPSNHQFYLG